MRILVDLKTHLDGTPAIVQVDRVQPYGVGTAINGKYVIPVIPGVQFPVDSASYVLDGFGEVDGGDVSSINFAHLLAMHPQFGHLYFNPLLTSTHVDELDFTATFLDNTVAPPVSYPSRFQSGRPVGLADSGQMPTHTAILPVNATTTPSHPGVLITKEIDISAYTSNLGADEFMVYWKLYDFQTGHDVASDFGATDGLNVPSIREVEEMDQEPTGLSVYLSPDNGGHWCLLGLLEPIAFCAKTTGFRVAFVNTSTSKAFVACLAVLF